MRSRDTWEMGVVNKSGWCFKILRAVRAYFYSQPPWSKASSYATDACVCVCVCVCVREREGEREREREREREIERQRKRVKESCRKHNDILCQVQ